MKVVDRAGFEPATPRMPSYFKEVHGFVSKFLTSSLYSEFFTWLVKERKDSEKWARNMLRYVKKPLSMSRDSIRAYRLLLRFLEEKYGVDVDKYLKKLKNRQTKPDLRVPSEDEIHRS
ncbi:MAG: hypothetical protein J7K82_08310, partial [Thermoproteales archaeon]|nr:hypothetical protein [Thermoproteales archaeon]